MTFSSVTNIIRISLTFRSHSCTNLGPSRRFERIALNFTYMKLPDFTELSYLASGSSMQQKAYRVLAEECVMQKLHQFSPILIGTFPLDVAIQTSDLDIACCVPDMGVFSESLLISFGNSDQYTFRMKIIRGKTVGIANFKIAAIPVEIFGEDRPVTQQYGYRHMIAEFQILERYGASFQADIRRLKSLGWKTEPAFAKLLGLSGDPYEELLKINISKL